MRIIKRSLYTRTALKVLCLITLGFAGCSPNASKVEQSPESFKVVNPVLLDTVYTKEYVAQIQSVQNVELRSRLKSFIENIYVDEGKEVQQGQVLFTLSDREFREDLLQANATLKAAIAELKSVEVEIKNSRTLVTKNIVSNAELEMAEAKKEAIEARIEEATSAISLAQLNLSFTKIRAPFSGVINRIPLKAGSLVEGGTLLTTLSNNKEVFAYFNVSEKEYLDYMDNPDEQKTKKVSLLLANDQLYEQDGIIETTESEINRATGSIAFRARLKNPRQLLKHGSSGKVLMKTPLRNVLVVPQKSTFEVQDKINVYVVDSNNVVRVKSFVPGLRLPHLYIVTSGLDKEDKIIYEGVQLIKEGQKVVPSLISFDHAAAQLAKK